MASCKTWVAIWVAFLVAAALGMAPALAQEEKKQLLPGNFTANVGLFSDYTFRGISQTRERPAIQGGLDWSMDTGFKDVGVYLGAWGSNVKFSDGGEATAELDWYGGLTSKVGPVDVKVGAIYYHYPGANENLNYNYVEGMIGLGYAINDALSVGLTYNGTPDNFGDSGHAHYFNGSVSYKVPVKAVNLTLFGNVGRYMIDNSTRFGAPSYWDWKVGASLAVTPNIAVQAFYTDTDINETTCPENCDPRGQIAVTASF